MVESWEGDCACFVAGSGAGVGLSGSPPVAGTPGRPLARHCGSLVRGRRRTGPPADFLDRLASVSRARQRWRRVGAGAARRIVDAAACAAVAGRRGTAPRLCLARSHLRLFLGSGPDGGHRCIDPISAGRRRPALERSAGWCQSGRGRRSRRGRSPLPASRPCRRLSRAPAHDPPARGRPRESDWRRA